MPVFGSYGPMIREPLPQLLPMRARICFGFTVSPLVWQPTGADIPPGAPPAEP